MPTSSHGTKKLAFLVITLCCVAVAIFYTLFSARSSKLAVRNLAPAAADQPQAAPFVSPPDKPAAPSQSEPEAPSVPPPVSSLASPLDKASAPSQDERQKQSPARLVAINLRSSDDLGKVEYSTLDAIDDRTTVTNLRCERIYFAATRGICLRREIKFLSAQTVATLLDANFQPLFSVRADGIPSRARVSPDGRYAAFTVFLTGHSYADTQLSTATLLLDIAGGATLANLEEFEVWQDGNLIKALDFNFWGVTFKHDSNFFYATLRTGGVNYLVHGDIRARTLTVMYKGVECPSLAPDETRIAFKKMISRANWRLTVLNLKTFEEIPLAETKSVDDQAEWLDNDHVLYAMSDPLPWMSIMVVSADGSGQTNVFAKGAKSPAVVR